jgi:RNA polymerase sigma factor (TIGR02999 family)
MLAPMGEDGRSEVTALLERVRLGERDAQDELLAIVYQDLRRQAGQRMSREPADHTLQPTALVHEAWLRLLGTDTQFKNRAHFFGVAAIAMRRILTERARRVQRVRHGGGMRRVDSVVELPSDADPLDVVLVNKALEELEGIDPEKAKIVTLRYLLGCTIEETAEALAISGSKVKQDWVFARAWLQQRVTNRDDEAS